MVLMFLSHVAGNDNDSMYDEAFIMLYKLFYMYVYGLLNRNRDHSHSILF